MMYFFSYDIANPKRLRMVAKTLENYGIRVQKSFFQCEMEETIKIKLKNQLLAIIDKKEDSLLIYPICNKCLNSIIKIGEGSFLEQIAFEII